MRKLNDPNPADFQQACQSARGTGGKGCSIQEQVHAIIRNKRAAAVDEAKRKAGFS
jgi:hypothetical protein